MSTPSGDPAPATIPAPAPMAITAVPRVEFDTVSVRYTSREGTYIEAVKDVTFRVEDKPGIGELIVFLGPSGCGKSTILKATAGLLAPWQGTVKVRGKEVDGPGRDRGMVFQAYTSFAWRSVLDNVAYGLEIQGVPKKERHEKAFALLKQVGLAEFATAFPKALSGGMKQRVAIARSLINDPAVLLMDEPFGALDPETRWSMQSLILDVVRAKDNTVLFVTHDVAEAVYLADTIYVLSARPARILRRVDVPFFKDRDVRLRQTAEFKEVENDLLATLHDRGVAGNIRVSF